MADYTHQTPSAHAAAPDVVVPESDHPAIDLNLPDLENPTDDQDQDSSVSDSESIVSDDHSGNALLPFIGAGLMELGEGDKVHRSIKERFVSRLGALGAQVTVVAIHRNCSSSVSARARAQAFQVYSQAVQKKGGGDTANVRYAWYAISREEVSKIFSYGFSYSGKPRNSGLYGCGVYFAPDNHPLECVKSAPADEDGLRHLLLCQVILGKQELISFGSEQSHPSSEQYDSGVDNLSSPRRYIVWSTQVNTHVLPEYVVSFRAPHRSRGLLRTLEKSRRPTSPWMPFRILILELSKILRPSDVNLISKYYRDHKAGRVSRHLLVQRVRHIAGDGLLTRIIKSFRIKQSRAEVADHGTRDGLE
ncbi:probable inactive poly [ADP-ribose] polymerase SRO5 [Syzygium oleosum]|uniref:probable inactive poly [ADP-ribose] polymerase SRO5 n=1 Tax=Syzygium oleosum TaxID=219896 RepID=UPI0011D28AD4|nr:probable inactive poly [ADP-ribose] polymerase SRO5 [Syzygium oleosum]XP_030458046.1 probable inactive poly [ADP-ribose] polymerase SRO5 [Syzygium oleosum]XP_056175034.1 probable inactive poly [ADP-ribose] polymerase SRO5 [Syzygium oleosum]